MRASTRLEKTAFWGKPCAKPWGKPCRKSLGKIKANFQQGIVEKDVEKVWRIKTNQP